MDNEKIQDKNIPSKSLIDKSNKSFNIPIFLSHPLSSNINNIQITFLLRLISEIENELLFPRTLPNTEQYPEPAMTNIRRLIYSSYGIVSVNLAQKKVKVVKTNGATALENNLGSEYWIGGDFYYIESAMAYQYGLPQLFIVESLVSSTGVFELGGISSYRVLIWDSSESMDSFFNGVEWKHMLKNWSAEVRNGYFNQTNPVYKF